MASEISTIDTKGDWKQYLDVLPTGICAAGTVTLPNGVTGALLRKDKSPWPSEYALSIKGQRPVILDAPQVESFLNHKQGILPKDPMFNGTQLVQMRISAEDAGTALRLGEGNLSKGVRVALRTSNLPLSEDDLLLAKELGEGNVLEGIKRALRNTEKPPRAYPEPADRQYVQGGLPKFVGSQMIHMRVSAEDVAAALRLGGGNISQGVRVALRNNTPTPAEETQTHPLL